MTQSRRMRVLFCAGLRGEGLAVILMRGANRAPPVADCCNDGSLNQESHKMGMKAAERSGRKRDAIFGGVVQRDRIRWFE